jgi:hypothetical protein
LYKDGPQGLPGRRKTIRRRSLLLAACVTTLLATPSMAGAATIGPDVHRLRDFDQGCTSYATCSFANTRQPDAAVRAPFSGTITRWRVNAANGSFRLQVLHRFADGSFKALRSTGWRTSSGNLASFGTNLAIHRHDFIALKETNGSTFGGALASSEARYIGFTPGLHDGESAFPNPAYSGTAGMMLFNTKLVH